MKLKRFIIVLLLWCTALAFIFSSCVKYESSLEESTRLWNFYSDQQNKWHWTRVDNNRIILETSTETFNTKEECIEDAKRKGYNPQKNNFIDNSHNKASGQDDIVVSPATSSQTPGNLNVSLSEVLLTDKELIDSSVVIARVKIEKTLEKTTKTLTSDLTPTVSLQKKVRRIL